MSLAVKVDAAAEDVSVAVSETKQETVDPIVTKLRSALLEPLLQLKVSDLDLSKKPIILSSALTPKMALEVLFEEHLRCAPVADAHTGKYIGVFDTRDFLKHTAEMWHSRHPSAADVSAMEYMTTAPHLSTNSLSYLARMKGFFAVRSDGPVIDVINVLSNGPHIVGVLDADTSVLKAVLTQGSVFGQIHDHWEKAGLLSEDGICQSIRVSQMLSESMDIGNFSVVTVPADAPTHMAFELMAKHDLSGLGVIDEDGQLIQNTSATDIKLWLKANHTLDEPIESFLGKIRRHPRVIQLLRKTVYPVSTVHLETDTLFKVIQKLAKTGYHRIWVVDENKKPVGVCALTDIFGFLCP